MSQDSREKFGVKSQMRGGGGGGWGEGGGEGEKREKGYVESRTSRGSIVCVNGVIIKQCGSYSKGSRGQNDTTHIEAAEGRGGRVPW